MSMLKTFKLEKCCLSSGPNFHWSTNRNKCLLQYVYCLFMQKWQAWNGLLHIFTGGRMISQLSSFRNNHAFATPLFFNVRLPAFATFLLSQPHAFATIFLLSQPFCLFGNVKKSSFRNKVLVSQQKSPRFATSFLVSHPSPRFATTKSSFRNNFPRFATLSKH